VQKNRWTEEARCCVDSTMSTVVMIALHPLAGLGAKVADVAVRTQDADHTCRTRVGVLAVTCAGDLGAAHCEKEGDEVATGGRNCQHR
jgi:hypothetical protein